MRGTFGSGGRFEAFHRERADGLATAEWIRAQPWCDGRIATAGPSYLGYTQWAFAPYLEEPPAAMCLGVTGSNFDLAQYDGGTLGLQTSLVWTVQTGLQETNKWGPLARPLVNRRIDAGLRSLPLGEADVVSLGKPSPYWREVVEHNGPGSEFWSDIDHSAAVAGTTAPISMVTGWWDIFLPLQLADFKTLAAAGRSPRLTVGPWNHGDPGSAKTMVHDQISFLAAHLQGDTTGLRRAPIRIFLQGAQRWLDLQQWPPAEVTERRLHLLPAGRLGADVPAQSGPDVFTYDPADPTPNVGGAVFAGKSKQQDQSTVERRSDVLTFTGPALTQPLDVVGDVVAEVFVQTDNGFGDLVVRLCDVDRAGRSLNVCDRIIRLTPEMAAGQQPVRLQLWPTAYRFRTGHRLRVQVAGGSFPRYPRNHGFGEPTATAVAMRPTRFQIHHDPDRPSGLILPVLP
ncbi:CocE/NonD family hydrolase [Fodinicola feengrottensis]|uniref:CocE/NonD family hydrolase n=1 Tax=Fodinicola feengrottensis TaxID=435914 RepID=UPI002440F2C3|nr:CocE/NonD family hydrolase [Fodinicola feengrottensis]